MFFYGPLNMDDNRPARNGFSPVWALGGPDVSDEW